MFREDHCWTKHWLGESFLQVLQLRCLKVTGWQAKRKLHFMSDQITRNPRLESSLVLQSAGSHHLLVTLFLIVVEALTFWYGLQYFFTFQLADCESKEACYFCGVKKTNLSRWVQQTRCPLGPTAWLLSTSMSRWSLWKLLWFLGQDTPHLSPEHTLSPSFTPGFWSHLVESHKIQIWLGFLTLLSIHS